MTEPCAKVFEEIPGVGKQMSIDFYDLGYRAVADLQNESPEQMYEKLMDLRACHIDRCVLYVFRCAVYYATHSQHDSQLLKWWNWKDEKLLQRKNKICSTD